MAAAERDRLGDRSQAIGARAPLRAGRGILRRCAALGILLTFGGCSLLVENTLSEKPSEGSPGQGSKGSEGSASTTANTGAGGALSCEACDAASCCDGGCVTLATSAAHCGVCGHACSSGQTCKDGACSPVWRPMSTSGEPPPRHHAAAVWTPQGMFVWSGHGDKADLPGGKLYDPLAGAWKPVSSDGAPSARARAACVWTGSTVIVWGGGAFMLEESRADGGRYDPSKDTWKPMANAMKSRREAVAVWTGSRMVVWGGREGPGPIGGGEAYDPVKDTWKTISDMKAPSPRTGVASAWTGTELLIFGGRPMGNGATSEGFAYNPATDTWRSMASKDAPSARYDAFAVWMNGELLVWGGRTAEDNDIDTGGRYSPTMDAWLEISTKGPPPKRSAPAGRTGWSAWTGSRALFLGGLSMDDLTTDAFQYSPSAAGWEEPLPSWPKGAPHEYGAAVWSGSEYFLWSGLDDKGMLLSGGESIQP